MTTDWEAFSVQSCSVIRKCGLIMLRIRLILLKQFRKKQHWCWLHFDLRVPSMFVCDSLIRKMFFIVGFSVSWIFCVVCNMVWDALIHDPQGAGHIHDIYPTFLKHAQKIFPHLICMDDLYKISDLSNPPNWWVTLCINVLNVQTHHLNSFRFLLGFHIIWDLI